MSISLIVVDRGNVMAHKNGAIDLVTLMFTSALPARSTFRGAVPEFQLGVPLEERKAASLMSTTESCVDFCATNSYHRFDCRCRLLLDVLLLLSVLSAMRFSSTPAFKLFVKMFAAPFSP